MFLTFLFIVLVQWICYCHVKKEEDVFEELPGLYLAPVVSSKLVATVDSTHKLVELDDGIQETLVPSIFRRSTVPCLSGWVFVDIHNTCLLSIQACAINSSRWRVINLKVQFYLWYLFVILFLFTFLSVLWIFKSLGNPLLSFLAVPKRPDRLHGASINVWRRKKVVKIDVIELISQFWR